MRQCLSRNFCGVYRSIYTYTYVTVHTRNTWDIALYFLLGQMIYRVFPCIAASYCLAKTHKGLRYIIRCGCGNKGWLSSGETCNPESLREPSGGGTSPMERAKKAVAKLQAPNAIWEVLHIYGLLFSASKQISGKSELEITCVIHGVIEMRNRNWTFIMLFFLPVQNLLR